MEGGKCMYHLVKLSLNDDNHPATWEKIDSAMKEVAFTSQGQHKSNSAVSYLGPFEGTQEAFLYHVNAHLYKHQLQMVTVEVEAFDLPEERFDQNGLGSVRAGN
jgi:hypothetical protein